ncbi:MAG TPA: DUF4386 domain-containing protein [Anaerolineales bacterium]|nr:DUF4386 domain-containing protein [Anaerolineales bacterium]
MTTRENIGSNKTARRALESSDGESLKTRSRMKYSRLIGALFLAGFLAYGVGFSLVASVINAPDLLSAISAQQTTLVVGAFLMLLNTVIDIGKGVLFFPILENHGKRTALTYLAALIVQVVMLDIGVLCLLMIVPLAQYTGQGWAEGLGSLLTQSNTMAYQIGQATLSFGGMFMTSLLFRTRLVPRPLAALGVIGYAIHAAGASAEIFGIHISLILLIPGMIFELALPVWLFIKGFQPEAYSGQTEVVTIPDVRPAPATL